MTDRASESVGSPPLIPPSPPPRRFTLDPREILVTFFYLGYAPIASGTFGTLGALALCLLIPRHWPFGITAAVLALFFLVIGVLCGPWAEQRFGRKDPKPFVLDEVMGFFVCVARPGPYPSWKELTAAFLLSRFFDVIKPPPARQIERWPKGWGIMGDDFIASVYAWLMLWVLRDYFHL